MRRAKLSELDLDGLRARIEEYIESSDQRFAHNAVGLILRNIAVRFGTRAANKVVRDLNLSDLYNIQEQRS